MSSTKRGLTNIAKKDLAKATDQARDLMGDPDPFQSQKDVDDVQEMINVRKARKKLQKGVQGSTA